MIIWSYWEGPQPGYITACIESMRRVLGDDLRVAHPEELPRLIAGRLHPGYEHITDLAVRCDCIRVALLAIEGGFWWDADTVAIRHPREWGDYSDVRALYAVWDAYPRRALNGYIYVSKEVANLWLGRVNQVLENHPDLVGWGIVGECLLTGLLLEEPDTIQADRRVFLPIDIDSSVSTFFEDRDPDELIEQDVLCFGLNNSWFLHHQGEHMRLPRDKWSDSPLLIHQLLARHGG